VLYSASGREVASSRDISGSGGAAVALSDPTHMEKLKLPFFGTLPCSSKTVPKYPKGVVIGE
jgi:hypothetical protein